MVQLPPKASNRKPAVLLPLASALTVFASALLLFWIQPLVAKVLLPWFGGSPATWAATSLFFQGCLVVGGLYIHRLLQRLGMRFAAVLHLALLVAAGIALAAQLLWRPGPLGSLLAAFGSEAPMPTAGVVLALTIAIGLPATLLASASPLVQRAVSLASPHLSPYWLYAVSNAGSLLGLALYLVILEPVWGLRTQSGAWVGVFYLAAAGTGLVLHTAMKMLPEHAPVAARASERRRSPVAEPSTTGFDRSMWVILPAISSALLLSTTIFLTQELAVMPWLWVIPLAIYLITYIACFATARAYLRWMWLGLYLATTLLVAGHLLFGWIALSGAGLMALYLGQLLAACMICHGELARRVPLAHVLTSFYLALSAGGLLGALCVTLLAPWLLRGPWDVALAALACWVIVAADYLASPDVAKGRHRLWLRGGAAAAAMGCLVVGLFFALTAQRQNQVYASRSFFGTLRVDFQQEPPAYRLYHGSTLHGFQYIDGSDGARPTSYYTPQSGVGLALRSKAGQADRLRVGVIGLGAGTLMAYARSGDVYRFYEIDPDVIRLAQGEGNFFTYLRDSQAITEVVAGDARLALEREDSEPPFDVLVIDAFTSGSIPIHLLTVEAWQVYLERLQPDGLLAFHISHPNLDLLQVIRGSMTQHPIAGGWVIDSYDEEDGLPCRWVVVSPDEDALRHPVLQGGGLPIPSDGRSVVWTDDHAELLSLLR